MTGGEVAGAGIGGILGQAGGRAGALGARAPPLGGPERAHAPRQGSNAAGALP